MIPADYQLTLLVTEGAHRGQRVSIARLPFVIGRAPGCHLRPNSPAVSGRHCALLARNAALLLTDLGSTSGTFLNGVRLAGTATVGDGDELAVGPLRFQLRVAMASRRAEASVEETAAQTLLDGEAARPFSAPLSPAPLPPYQHLPMRRSSPAAAARGILEMLRREEKQGRS